MITVGRSLVAGPGVFSTGHRTCTPMYLRAPVRRYNAITQYQRKGDSAAHLELYIALKHTEESLRVLGFNDDEAWRLAWGER